MAFYDSASFERDRAIGYLLRVCSQHGMAQLDRAFADEDLTAMHWATMLSIALDRDATCAIVARDMAYDKGAMSRMIDVLEARGLVRRERNSDDRRCNNLTLTPEGAALTERCRLIALALWNEWLEGWSDEEVTLFIAQLQRLRRTMEAAGPCAA